MKKEWSLPKIEEINISATAAGGTTVTKHDGKVYEDPEGKLPAYEEYWPVSGEKTN